MQFSSELKAVAYCRTPYKQKFGIPRQPGLVDVHGYVELVDEFNHIDAVRGLEQYSHLWLLFSFHENLAQGWKTTVRPPRLGGNEKLGVFATRSTFRPNGIGQSVVKLHKVLTDNGKVMLEISGMDLLDGTPIVDIKPYIPFSDAIPHARGGIAHEAPELITVEFNDLAKQALLELTAQKDKPEYQGLPQLIDGVLSQDPRPAYKKAKADPKLYQVALYDLDIFWLVEQDKIIVVDITKGMLSKEKNQIPEPNHGK